ncbi:hypothetical protein G6F57_012241 [Rhizopus arrhizus]|uniref:Tc1-like transposase DDE domain-containing protein n=1 Tax=Rhizopus oryzae TaxID=64495 RepID=A0A9P6WX27_RHIOR|nr:hypothetical protein G6F30_011835 [Rhizopus arrhizus]KAG0977803.1 hypothetical protein G6F29_009795 [Rhizopus arrhizus]KAG0991524.1 hypothetical protein G6F28_008507 [Rhizopus arrhizus]KAG1007855.1 hypothetical protein G6F27_007024 [Rhizopus arrhizus]KAG1021091.1 hypothetical protein G6F26_008746 [Rhizopus arrhizus]
MSAAWPSREQPLARNSAENLEKRYQQVKKWVKTTDMKNLTNRIFVDEAGFNINMKSPNARSVRGTPAIVETPTTRAIAHTIVGAITAQDVISVEIREPLKSKKVKVDGSRKRKKSVAKKMSKETVTGHYMKFICKTLDELDKVPEMRNFYIMDNTPIQTSENITKLIETRGYRAIHLPSYSPELYSIENF